MTLMRSSKIRLTFVVVSVVAVAWTAGLVSYAAQVPREVKDTTTETDAIVVLTGGSGRIETGLDLLAQGLAARLFISGVGPSVSAGTLVDGSMPNRDALLEKIAVGDEAEDTPGNAIETATWASAYEVTSIRLVTAAYHMPRALRELRWAMPDVTVIPHPVFPDQVKSEWWRYPGTTGLLSREYSKYVLATFRLTFLSADRQP